MQVRSILALIAVCVLPLVLARSVARPAIELIDASNIDAAFQQGDFKLATMFSSFKKTHNKVYESAEHEANRFSIFKANVARAAELALKNPEASFGVNRFSDLHPVEFKKQYLNYVPAVGDAALLRAAAPVRKSSTPVKLPSNFDWRKPDNNRPVGITAVKDQGQCGSCWAFSATEAVESAWILGGHKAVNLAPQQTVDCDTVDQGCNGGDTVSAFDYMKRVGLEAESTYPYVSGDSGSANTCAYNKSAVVAKMTGFVYATPGCTDSCASQNEALLAQNLYKNGPVSICVDASTWQSYNSGILTAASGCQSAYTALDHCVQLIGFGIDATSGQKYWTVRNSWADSWGEAGMIRLAYGANTCGVADEATQVTL